MNIEVTFSEANEVRLPVVFSESSQEIDAGFGEIQSVHVGGEVYKGDYTVTPKMEGQTMPTKGKVLIDDVVVKAIPVFRVSNTSGGTTVYIANEV